MDFVKREDFKRTISNLRKLINAKGQKPQVETRTLSDNLELRVHDTRVQFIDPGGASRDVWLPSVFQLDGSPWLAKVYCQNGECDACQERLHVYSMPFPLNNYFFIFNTSDSSGEDLTFKYKRENWETETTECDTGKNHDTPTKELGENEYPVFSLAKDEGCILFCDGVTWRGFKGGI